MTTWNIAVTYDGILAPDQAVFISECLSRHDGNAINIPPDRFVVSMYADIHLKDAMHGGVDVINRAVASSGAPAEEVHTIEIHSLTELERLAEQPNYPELVSAGEVADLLNVRRQRVHQLAARGGEFPAPLYELAAGKLWDASAIKAYARLRRTDPGRPKRPEPAQTPTPSKVGSAASRVTQRAVRNAARKAEAGARRRSSA